MVQGKITEADIPTLRLGAIPPGLISHPPPSSPYFYAGCLSCRNSPNLSWLGTGTKYAGLHTQWVQECQSSEVKLKYWPYAGKITHRLHPFLIHQLSLRE